MSSKQDTVADSTTEAEYIAAYEAGKMTKAKHPSKTIMTTTRPFELLHMDLFGPTHYVGDMP